MTPDTLSKTMIIDKTSLENDGYKPCNPLKKSGSILLNNQHYYTTEGRRLSGHLDGRPKKYKKEQPEHTMFLLENHSYKQIAAMTGIFVSTLRFYIFDMNIIKSPTGNAITACVNIPITAYFMWCQ